MENRLISDVHLQNLIEAISETTPYAITVGNIRKLKQYLFDTYCMKGPSRDCTPEYCSYSLREHCDYANAIKVIYHKYGIDIIKERLTNA